VWRLHRYNGGTPRLVNAVCDKSLLAGYVRKQKRIGYSLVNRAIRELEGEIH